MADRDAPRLELEARRLGRGIERELPPGVAEELAAAQGSFEQTVELFRRVAREVGDALGYVYPQYADDVVSAYIDRPN